MNPHSVTLCISLVALTGAFSYPPRSIAAPIASDLICLTEGPAIVEGENTSLRVLAVTSAGHAVSTDSRVVWDVDAGRVEIQSGTTGWNLSAVTLGSEEVRKVVATARFNQPGQNQLHCTVEVFIGKKGTTEPDRGVQGEIISARHFLLPAGEVVPGYGLYSYLLFSAPPKNDEESARYLKTIEACLLVLQDVDEYLRRHVRSRNLNATYIPIRNIVTAGKSNAEWAMNVLSAYDYAAARILLNKLRQDHEQGPYLVSVLEPLVASETSAYLSQNLAGVVPDLAWDWVKTFTYLTAQQRSWTDESLALFGLKLRNLIAVGGKVTPNVINALDKAKAIQFTPKT